MDGILDFFLLPALPGLAAVALGLLLRRWTWLEEQRYSLPVLGLVVCGSGFALLEYIYSAWADIRIVLALSLPLVAGLLVRNRGLVAFGSLFLWIVSVFLNFPLTVLVDPIPGTAWTMLGFLIAFAGFFLVLTPFAWYSREQQPQQEYLSGTTNRNES